MSKELDLTSKPNRLEHAKRILENNAKYGKKGTLPVGSKKNPAKYNGLTKAQDEEPIFTLLGRDPMAPVLIELWCLLREAEKEDPAQVQEARDIANAMVDWLKNKGRLPIRKETALKVLQAYKPNEANLNSKNDRMK